jgi:RNase P/RNase MRP subunit p29
MLIDNYLEKELVGKRVRLIEPMDDPHPILVGREGLVYNVGYGVVNVKWDNGRTLGLIIGQDIFEVIN